MSVFGIRATDGTATEPTLSFQNEQDCGFYRIGANNLGMSIGGAKVLDFSPAGVAFGTGTDRLGTYEEGVWTPALVGSTTAGVQTYAVQVGHHIRIGKLVFAWWNIELTSKDASTAGSLFITGLPVAAGGTGHRGYTSALEVQLIDLNTAGGYYSAVGRVLTGTSQIELLEVGDNVSSASLTDADFASNSVIRGGIFYRTA